MAKPTKFTVSFSKMTDLKPITGNFENIRLEASLEMELEEGDDLVTEYNKAYMQVMKEVLTKSAQIAKRL